MTSKKECKQIYQRDKLAGKRQHPTWAKTVDTWNRDQWLIPPAYFKDKRPYFNMTNPDPYTYLQYWRRRMCFDNYRGYMGMQTSGRNCAVWNYNNVAGRCRYPAKGSSSEYPVVPPGTRR